MINLFDLIAVRPFVAAQHCFCVAALTIRFVESLDCGVNRGQRLGPDPIKKFQRKIQLCAGPITELKKGHVTDVIGPIPAWSKILR